MPDGYDVNDFKAIDEEDDSDVEYYEHDDHDPRIVEILDCNEDQTVASSAEKPPTTPTACRQVHFTSSINSNNDDEDNNNNSKQLIISKNAAQFRSPLLRYVLPLSSPTTNGHSPTTSTFAKSYDSISNASFRSGKIFIKS